MRQERSNYMMLKHDVMADEIEEQKAGQQEGDMCCNIDAQRKQNWQQNITQNGAIDCGDSTNPVQSMSGLEPGPAQPAEGCTR